jgi:hypothetical protein
MQGLSNMIFMGWALRKLITSRPMSTKIVVCAFLCFVLGPQKVPT